MLNSPQSHASYFVYSGENPFAGPTCCLTKRKRSVFLTVNLCSYFLCFPAPSLSIFFPHIAGGPSLTLDER
jgi:hypothetical protein